MFSLQSIKASDYESTSCAYGMSNSFGMLVCCFVGVDVWYSVNFMKFGWSVAGTQIKCFFFSFCCTVFIFQYKNFVYISEFCFYNFFLFLKRKLQFLFTYNYLHSVSCFLFIFLKFYKYKKLPFSCSLKWYLTKGGQFLYRFSGVFWSVKNTEMLASKDFFSIWSMSCHL